MAPITVLLLLLVLEALIQSGIAQTAPAPPPGGSEKGFVSSIAVLPEYAVWLESDYQSNATH